jgi:hypothetical protein
MLGSFFKFVQETKAVSDKQAGKKGDVSHN